MTPDERLRLADAAHDCGIQLAAFLVEYGDRLGDGPNAVNFRACALSMVARLDILSELAAEAAT